MYQGIIARMTTRYPPRYKRPQAAAVVVTSRIRSQANYRTISSFHRPINPLIQAPIFLKHLSQFPTHQNRRMATTTPTPTYKKLDFTALGLPEYKHHYAVLLENVFTPTECDALVRTAEASSPSKGWELAQINVGNGLQQTRTDIRNSSRIMLDDHDLAKKLLDRVLPFVEGDIGILDAKDRKSGIHILAGEQGFWQLTRLNERLRFLKYKGGEYFKPHYDGQYVTPDGAEISYLTFQLYLRSPDPEDNKEPLQGGSTRIFSYDMNEYYDVEAKPGSVFIFQHDILHSGEPVTSGVKIAVRTDFMYELGER